MNRGAPIAFGKICKSHLRSAPGNNVPRGFGLVRHPTRWCCMGKKRFSREFEILRGWDELPNDAIISVKTAAFILNLNERTVRYHPHLQRVWLSKARYGFRRADVCRLLRGGFKEAVA
jgi:hypothetical protein